MGSSSSKDHFVNCTYCKDRRATYRCETTIPFKSKGGLTFYNGSTTPSSIFASTALDDRQKEAYTLLLPHWSGSMGEKDLVKVRWVACDTCIKPNTKKYFQHIPKGWKESESTFSKEINYERIRY